MEGWAKIKPAAQYAGISERTLRQWLKEGLRHTRLKTGTVLIKYTWVDEFLEQFEVGSESEVERIVNSIKINGKD